MIGLLEGQDLMQWVLHTRHAKWSAKAWQRDVRRTDTTPALIADGIGLQPPSRSKLLCRKERLSHQRTDQP